MGQSGVLAEELAHLDAPLGAAGQACQTAAARSQAARSAERLGHGEESLQTELGLADADGAESGALGVGEVGKEVAERELDGDFLAARGRVGDVGEELVEKGGADDEETQHGGLVELGGGEEGAVRRGARAGVDEGGVGEERLDAAARVVGERVGEGRLAAEVPERGVGAVAQEDLAEGGRGGLAGEHESGLSVGVLEVEDGAERRGRGRRGGGEGGRGEGGGERKGRGGEGNGGGRGVDTGMQ